MRCRDAMVRLLVACWLAVCSSKGRCADEVVSQDPAKPDLRTIAESSDFRATATYQEVMDLARQLADHSPSVHLISMGTSHEGRDLPLLIVADPPVKEVSDLADGKRIIIFAMGNIHAGEVCGKEALLMLVRDLTQPNVSPVLRQVVLLVAPIYNADGNDKMAKDNRPGQNGPEHGMGQRENGQGLDLNRDHVKLESPEARALARVLTEWNPHLVIDTHTTNGSEHGYTITYDGPRHPATPSSLIEYARDKLLPEVSRRLEASSGYRSTFYGNFSPQRDRWETYPAWPRYNTPYVGLRGHLGILSEAYAYASYRDRVLATRDFVRTIAEFAAERPDEIRGEIDRARKALAKGNKLAAPVAVASRMGPLPDPLRLLVPTRAAHADRNRPDTPPPTEKAELATVSLLFEGASEPVETVQVPWAYVIPPVREDIVNKLQQHGVALEVLREDRKLSVEQYLIEDWKTDAEPFQGHYLAKVRVLSEPAVVDVTAGTVIARTDQQLGRLLVELLEPHAEDGLLTWNFFDDLRTDGNGLVTFPVLRLMQPQAVLTAKLPQRTGSTDRRRLRFDDVVGQRALPAGGRPQGEVDWLPGGEHYVQARDKVLYKFHAHDGTCSALFDRRALMRALAKAANVERSVVKDAMDPSRWVCNENFTQAITEFMQDYYLLKFDEDTAKRLTNTPAEEELVTFSPDGSRIAFVRDYDLYTMAIDTQEERRLTFDGNRLLRYGKADWVYFEEVYNRNWRGYRWSPDSRSIAFLEFDDRPVYDFTVLRHLTPRGFVEQERYPKAGDPIPVVRLGVTPADGGSITWIDLDHYSRDNRIVTRFGWLHDSQRLFCLVQNRAQKWLDYCHADVRSGSRKLLFRTRSPYWVDDPEDPVYLRDGSFLLCSERDGWRHVYQFEADGSLRRQVTQGEWEVRSLDQVNEDTGWAYFHGTRDSHAASNLYRVRLDGSELQRLTPEDGDHVAKVAAAGNCFVDVFSNLTRPTRVVLRGPNGVHLRTIDSNPVHVLDDIERGDVVMFEIPLSDGRSIPGMLTYPADFDPSRKYPVWLMTYGGPHAPSVFNRWQNGRLMDHLLATEGILVFRCDPTSASGRGAKSTWMAYEQLGVQETRDLDEAADWLCEKPYVDASRIGMSGYSYGGYLTSYVLTHSKKFAAGIAGAPVTDWRNYDAFYTERYMNTPQENPEGYDRSSVVKAAKNLHGRLLLVHGAMDDNVHVQNTLQLTHELQEHDIAFELMVYPTSRHPIFSNHFQRLSYDFIRRTMLNTSE